MKRLLFLCLILACVCSSCDKDENYEYYNVAKPELMSKAEFRNSVEVLAPQSIQQEGKIYAYNNYIFINDKFEGVHVLDNTNPQNPQSIAFIRIPGNEDVAVKDGYLYADSSIDLVVFDISNISMIHEVARLEDVFSVYDYQIPAEAEYADFADFNSDESVIVGWEIVRERREINDDVVFIETANGWDFTSSPGGSVGVGGSLARFQIVDDYLYTVGTYEMDIFDISNLSTPSLSGNLYAGWNIETMFRSGDYLYLGSTNGMYIYDIENRLQPTYISEFTHWEGCDPVVVDGDYAYLTLRGGNLCGQELSVLEVIDISDKYYPTLVGQYILDNPYGLGIKGNNLFVCDGTSGLKVFDKSNPLSLQQTQHFQNAEGFDVIPLDNVLLMVGDDVLYQYDYTNDSITLLSTYQL